MEEECCVMTASKGTDYRPASSPIDLNGGRFRSDAGEKTFSVGAVPKQEATSGSGLASQPKRKLRVLVVEDDPADVELVVRALRSGGFEPESDTAQTAQEFSERIHKNSYDVVLADYNLPSWNGMETVEVLRREGADVPVVLVSGSLGEHKAVECIKQGAADYVLKDHLARLSESVRRALRERKLREEHRHSLEELARSNRDLEQFAYVASHDLQEPLRMVATYTQLLAERYQGKLDENADKYIHYAVEGALRMQTLVQDLLAFSRVGRHGTEFAVTECNPVVETALKNLHNAIEESKAQITCETLPAVMADRSQLVQVFQNLIGNALKFRGASAPVIRVSAEKKRREWIFSVSDNGIGIAPEHAEIIFVIFKRLHTRAEYPGSGIGLAICQKIVERHGGRIWVESEPGKGSSFKFALPVCEVRGEYDPIDENRG
jgi:signal transduction histidine kinase